MDVWQSLIGLLDQKGIGFEYLPHPPEGNTVVASKLRGHCLSDAAKSMLVGIKDHKSKTTLKHVLAVVPGHRLIDFKAIAKMNRQKRAELASGEELARLTQCVSGSVPPFSFHPEVSVIVDTHIANRSRIFFNAGRLDRSISIDTENYLEQFGFQVAEISKLASHDG